MATTFGVAKRGVAIVAGERCKLKRLAIDVDEQRAAAVLQSLGVDPGGLPHRAR